MPVPIELPPPRDWQVFEDLCRDIFAAEWRDPETQKHGRPGQEQNGVDIFGHRDGRWQGVQCKRKQQFPETKLTAAEVRAEVSAARTFAQPLETLVIATTAPPDKAIQALAIQITEEHREEGIFRVVVYGWSELCGKLQRHRPVVTFWQQELLGKPHPEGTEVSDVDLGVEPAAWLEALDEARRFLVRRQSVNLVVQGKVAWRELIDQLAREHVTDLVTVNLENPNTVSRRGLVGEILRSLEVPITVPPEPEDLGVLGRVLDERTVSRVALTHFDLARYRDSYGVDLFSSLRYLLMESRKLVLLVQSKKPFATLLPDNHPLSMIDVKTVELRGQP